MKIAEQPQLKTTATTTHESKTSAHQQMIKLIKTSDYLQKQISKNRKSEEDEVIRILKNTEFYDSFSVINAEFLVDGLQAALDLIEEKMKEGYTIDGREPPLTINSLTDYIVVSLRRPESVHEHARARMKANSLEQCRTTSEQELSRLVTRHTEINNQIQELLPELKALH